MFRKSTLAPRNPLVAASLFRKAGTHRRHGKAARAQEKQRYRHQDQLESRLRQDSNPKRMRVGMRLGLESFLNTPLTQPDSVPSS